MSVVVSISGPDRVYAGETLCGEVTFMSREPVALLAGSVRLEGALHIDGEVLDDALFAAVRSRFVASPQNNGPGFLLRWWNSTGSNDVADTKVYPRACPPVPLVVPVQELLFGEAEAGGSPRTWKWVLTVPVECPPSYSGVHSTTEYLVVVGYACGSAKFEQRRQVRVLPYVDTAGRMGVFNLHQPSMATNDHPGVRALQAAVGKSTPFVPASEALPAVMADVSERVVPHDDCPFVPRLESSAVVERMLTQFRLAQGSSLVARVTTSTAAVRLGGTVTVQLDFSEAELACAGVAVGFVPAEQYPELAWQDGAEVVVCPAVLRTAINTLGSLSETVVVPLPASAPCQFRSDWVSVLWSLRFEFVLLAGSEAVTDHTLYPQASADATGALYVGARDLLGQMLTVDVPIAVLP